MSCTVYVFGTTTNLHLRNCLIQDREGLDEGNYNAGSIENTVRYYEGLEEGKHKEISNTGGTMRDCDNSPQGWHQTYSNTV